MKNNAYLFVRTYWQYTELEVNETKNSKQNEQKLDLKIFAVQKLF